jgi:hypothetical protein
MGGAQYEEGLFIKARSMYNDRLSGMPVIQIANCLLGQIPIWPLLGKVIKQKK